MCQAASVDVVQQSAYMLEFLSEVTAPFPAPDKLELSYAAFTGFSLILAHIADGLELAAKTMCAETTQEV